ncbi:MAG: proline--tRNA ligase [Xylanivirga thermophila]|jgi:prolyl-tRNA synthetase|uniref:proline--tRNA ligase n=1 Tax=Xylanivirga thermophila TaxID=2496273 RepID=UPI00101DFBCF|nr:proline--tRNA ligase [Xylanivirga thermophila]
MAQKKQEFVAHITPREEDFSQWYTDVIMKADLVDYSPVKGCMVIKPYGYAIWENIQRELDERFKATGHKNAYFPLFIPESLLKKEEEHVEGFAPEVAWVTHGGDEELAERLVVRPTSETIICAMYSKWVQSYRDLPLLYNQWCSVVRWEKSTRPFLRTSEFLWQEGHTVHASYEEAQEETLKMLDVYDEFAKNVLAIPMITGQKTEKEKFAGALSTYTMEALMQDGKALQAGTSHNLGQHFAKVFDIQYLDKDGQLKYVWQTSWGVSTRLIGGIIMVHGDERGLVLPPKVAPIQVVIVPVAMHKEGVLEKARELYDELKKAGLRVELDDRDTQSPGWKFNEWELKGVPIRLEIGPRDIKNNQVVLVRRDSLEKIGASMEDISDTVINMLDSINDGIYEKALSMRDEHTYAAGNMDEFKEALENKKGFVKAMWCGRRECEDAIKDATGATTRCMPFKQEHLGDKCVCCGQEAKHMVYFAKAY